MFSYNWSIIKKTKKICLAAASTKCHIPKVLKTSYRVYIRRKKYGPRCPTWKYKHELFVEMIRNFLSSISKQDKEKFLKSRPYMTIKAPFPKKKLRAVLQVVPSSAELGIQEDIDRMRKAFPIKKEEETAEYVDTSSTEDLTSLKDTKPESCLSLNGEWLIPKKNLNEGKVIYYIHGGAYILCSPGTHRPLTWRLADYSKYSLFAVDYRLAPEYAFPCALEDVFRGYMFLIKEKGYKPENIIVAGDSAGGGLSLSLSLYLRDHGYPTPGCIYLISPWVDLTCSSESWTKHIEYDYLMNPASLGLLNPALLYGHSFIKSQYVSPLNSEDFSNLPPVLIQLGDIEVLFDEVNKLYNKMSNAYEDPPSESKDIDGTKTLGGDTCRLEIYRDMPHVFQMFSLFEASEKAIRSAVAFIKSHTSK